MIRDITVHLPNGRLGNDELAAQLGKWTPDEIFRKTGIRTRCVAKDGETAADLGSHALAELLRRQETPAVDFLILCTQSADYKLPSSACLMQASAGLPTSCGCLDVNLACSGYVYGLMLAEGLMASGAVQSVALVNSDTYTHYIHPDDHVCRPIFGDGAAATLLTAQGPGGRVRGFCMGTDGSHALKMYLPAGGARMPLGSESRPAGSPTMPSDPEFLQMNGPEVFNFTLHAVPGAVASTLSQCGLGIGEIDYFVFHQANGFMLEALRRKIGVAHEKFVIDMAETGNLVSASIPTVLARMRFDGRIRPGVRTLLCGFGVGLSWASCLVEW